MVPGNSYLKILRHTQKSFLDYEKAFEGPHRKEALEMWLYHGMLKNRKKVEISRSFHEWREVQILAAH